MRVAVVGAGSWGTTLADLLARAGRQVRLWAREAEVVRSITTEHVNTMFLPNSPLSPDMAAFGEVKSVVADADIVVMAAPSHAMRQVGAEVNQSLGSARPVVVSVSKGLEPGSLATMSVVLAETIPGRLVVALSGPSFASEVYQRQPTAVVAASNDPDAARCVQQAFATGAFRVYTASDVKGVELGGALKNVIAIAAGILEGLGLGNNPRAGLITRGLAEMTRLGTALGADPLTFAGLAGMGDLILTATGALSRNRSLGVELGQGQTLEQVMRGRLTVAEGVTTARAAAELGRRTGVELPITREVSEVLFNGKAPRQAVQDLMNRELKAEQWR